MLSSAEVPGSMRDVELRTDVSCLGMDSSFIALHDPLHDADTFPKDPYISRRRHCWPHFLLHYRFLPPKLPSLRLQHYDPFWLASHPTILPRLAIPQ